MCDVEDGVISVVKSVSCVFRFCGKERFVFEGEGFILISFW